MRSVIVMMIFMAILVPQVQAVGIATMDDYSDGFEMDRGESIDLDFSLRGDDKVNDVTFFIYAEGAGVEFDGKERIEDEYHLSVYENEDVSVDMEAKREGIWTVNWGYYQGGDGEGFDIKAFVEDSFVVEVSDDGNDGNDDEFDVLVDSTTSSSGGSSGGGGGGGGGSFFTTSDDEKVFDEYGLWYDEEGIAYDEQGNIIEPDYIEFLMADSEEQEQILQDVSSQDSSLNEIVVDDSDDGSSLVPLGVGDDGKNFLVVVLALGMFATLSTFGAVKYMNKEGRS